MTKLNTQIVQIPLTAPGNNQSNKSNCAFHLRRHPSGPHPTPSEAQVVSFPEPRNETESPAHPLFSADPERTKTKMPTLESEAFKAKKPTVPPTYDGVDYDDNVAVHNARDAVIREQWVRSMMSRLVGEELGKCYSREGVNHLEKCGVLRGEFLSFSQCPVLCWTGTDKGISVRKWRNANGTEKYFELIGERKIRGYLGQEKNYFTEK